jgi:signal transduction histidine kinase
VNSEGNTRSALAQLRHQLRTPLNHVIGYTEILLEDLGLEGRPDAEHPLNVIYASARQVLELVQQFLSPGYGDVPTADIEKLRNEMIAPVQGIIRNVGLLADNAESDHLLDLLRISNAASELLAFAHGQLPKSAPVPPSVASAEEAAPLAAYVLLVDDDESNRDMLTRQLERTGCRVACAEDGEDAIRVLARDSYDLVLLDVIMPGLDGMAALERIRTRGDGAPPVIMISALDEMDSVRRCLELGAEDYLLKPFDPVLLRSRLTATLERSRLRSLERERTRALEDALNRLKDINDNLQQFAYAASHDLKSPIRTVTLMSQMLARRYKGKLDEEADELINSITDAMRRMDELVSALLAYSQLDTRAENQSEFSLDLALDDALANLQQDIRVTAATVERSRLPLVTGRRAHFVQLFQNLIQNSLKYRGTAPPRVQITSEDGPSECIVHVRDNGIGFEAGYAGRIFEPFHRLHGQEYPGSGIGLSICAKIVGQYGGRIWAESAVNQGSVFSFSIPSVLCRSAGENAVLSSAT